MNKLKSILEKNNIDGKLITFDSASTHTALDAAKALNCQVGEIIRTLLFTNSQQYFLVIITGDKKVDMQKLKILTGSKRPELASRSEVLQQLGYPVGGVPCIISTQIPIFIDSSIKTYTRVYSGGGDANTVLEIKTDDIVHYWNVDCVDISK